MKVPAFFTVFSFLALLPAVSLPAELPAATPLPALAAPAKPLTVPLPAGVSLEMLPVPAGEFFMGSPASEQGRDGDERRHRVKLTRPFWLGKYEVTQAQYKAVAGVNPSHFKSSGENAPVENVSYDDALAFCAKLTERERAAGRLPAGHVFTLPTEAQWEFACRAGSETPFAGSAKLADVGWFNRNSGRRTHPVGQKKPNAWGFYDMHGNVWEWTLDWLGDYETGAPEDGLLGKNGRGEFAGVKVNPAGAAGGTKRVSKGGGWSYTARFHRCAQRGVNVQNRRYFVLGFRVALAPVP